MYFSFRNKITVTSVPNTVLSTEIKKYFKSIVRTQRSEHLIRNTTQVWYLVHVYTKVIYGFGILQLLFPVTGYKPLNLNDTSTVKMMFYIKSK